LDRLERRERGAERDARETVESLRASGARYDFEAVSRAAKLVLGAEEPVFLPRLVGFLDVLRDVVEGGIGSGSLPHGWLVRAAGPFAEASPLALEELAADRDLRSTWRRAAALLGVDEAEVAGRVAERL